MITHKKLSWCFYISVALRALNNTRGYDSSMGKFGSWKNGVFTEDNNSDLRIADISKLARTSAGVQTALKGLEMAMDAVGTFKSMSKFDNGLALGVQARAKNLINLDWNNTTTTGLMNQAASGLFGAPNITYRQMIGSKGKAAGRGLAAVGSGAAKGAAAGMTFGPWGAAVGAIAGALSNGMAAIFGRAKAKRAATRLANETNALNKASQLIATTNMARNAGDIQLMGTRAHLSNLVAFGGNLYEGGGAIDYANTQRFLNNGEMAAMGNLSKITALPNSFTKLSVGGLFNGILNIYDFGGEMNANGATYTPGLSHIDAGGTHEENPNLGVPMGTDREGTPNFVEEGESIYNNYVFSDRLKVPNIPKGHLKDKKKMTYEEKVLKPYQGMTFSEAAKKAEKTIYGEGGNLNGKQQILYTNQKDKADTLEAILMVLAETQEKLKQEEEMKQLQEAIANMSPEELQALEQQIAAMLQQDVQQQLMAEQLAMQQLLMLQPQMTPEELAALEQQLMMLQLQPTEEEMMAMQQLQLAAQQLAILLQAMEQQAMLQAAMQGLMSYGGNLYADGGNLNTGNYFYSGGDKTIKNKDHTYTITRSDDGSYIMLDETGRQTLSGFLGSVLNDAGYKHDLYPSSYITEEDVYNSKEITYNGKKYYLMPLNTEDSDYEVFDENWKLVPTVSEKLKKAGVNLTDVYKAENVAEEAKALKDSRSFTLDGKKYNLSFDEDGNIQMTKGNGQKLSEDELKSFVKDYMPGKNIEDIFNIPSANFDAEVKKNNRAVKQYKNYVKKLKLNYDKLYKENPLKVAADLLAVRKDPTLLESDNNKELFINLFKPEKGVYTNTAFNRAAVKYDYTQTAQGLNPLSLLYNDESKKYTLPYERIIGGTPTTSTVKPLTYDDKTGYYQSGDIIDTNPFVEGNLYGLYNTKDDWDWNTYGYRDPETGKWISVDDKMPTMELAQLSVGTGVQDNRFKAVNLFPKGFDVDKYESSDDYINYYADLVSNALSKNPDPNVLKRLYYIGELTKSFNPEEVRNKNRYFKDGVDPTKLTKADLRLVDENDLSKGYYIGGDNQFFTVNVPEEGGVINPDRQYYKMPDGVYIREGNKLYNDLSLEEKDKLEKLPYTGLTKLDIIDLIRIFKNDYPNNSERYSDVPSTSLWKAMFDNMLGYHYLMPNRVKSADRNVMWNPVTNQAVTVNGLTVYLPENPGDLYEAVLNDKDGVVGNETLGDYNISLKGYTPKALSGFTVANDDGTRTFYTQDQLEKLAPYILEDPDAKVEWGNLVPGFDDTSSIKHYKLKDVASEQPEKTIQQQQQTGQPMREFDPTPWMSGAIGLAQMFHEELPINTPVGTAHYYTERPAPLAPAEFVDWWNGVLPIHQQTKSGLQELLNNAGLNPSSKAGFMSNVIHKGNVAAAEAALNGIKYNNEVRAQWNDALAKRDLMMISGQAEADRLNELARQLTELLLAEAAMARHEQSRYNDAVKANALLNMLNMSNYAYKNRVGLDATNRLIDASAIPGSLELKYLEGLYGIRRRSNGGYLNVGLGI